MKKIFLGTLVLLGLPLITACGGQSGSVANSSSSEVQSQKSNLISEAEKLVSDDQFYQAQDVLKKAQKNKETQDKAMAFLDQIDLYKKAENAYDDDRYEVASDNVDQVINQKDGSNVMKDKADKLKEKIEKAKDKHEQQSSQEKEKSESSEKNKKEQNIVGKSVGEDKSLAWNSNKTIQLNHFMDSWAKKMGQTYYELTFSEPVETLGHYSINDLVNGSVAPKVSGKTTSFSYGKSGAYKVVAAYDGTTNDGTSTTYVFAIGPGGPVALVAQGTSNGEDGSVNFKPTANTTLQNGFANIANHN